VRFALAIEGTAQRILDCRADLLRADVRERVHAVGELDLDPRRDAGHHGAAAELGVLDQLADLERLTRRVRADRALDGAPREVGQLGQALEERLHDAGRRLGNAGLAGAAERDWSSWLLACRQCHNVVRRRRHAFFAQHHLPRELRFFRAAETTAAASAAKVEQGARYLQIVARTP